MKKLIPLTLLFFAFGCSQDDTETAYITDNDFAIKIVSWESRGDTINDGITQNVLLEKGDTGIVTFKKSTGEVKEDDYEVEIANKSVNGLLIFNNYWGKNPKIVDFTVAGQYKISYDSTKDLKSGSYEVSTTVAYYTKM
jgi:hypothetical protein